MEKAKQQIGPRDTISAEQLQSAIRTRCGQHAIGISLIGEQPSGAIGESQLRWPKKLYRTTKGMQHDYHLLQVKRDLDKAQQHSYEADEITQMDGLETINAYRIAKQGE